MRMPSKTETAARRLVVEIYRATKNGQPMRWCTLANLGEAAADVEAIHFAALKDWIILEPRDDPHSAMLTDAGRQVAAPSRQAAVRPKK